MNRNSGFQLEAIAAMSKNRVIDSNNKIPWYIPSEFQWFKKTTMGDILIMGRKTFESIGKPLPGREIIVISKSKENIEGVTVIKNIKDIFNLNTERTIWITGGEKIYKNLLPECSEIILSIINQEFEGDAFFPKFEKNFKLEKTIKKEKEFIIQKWIKQ